MLLRCYLPVSSLSSALSCVGVLYVRRPLLPILEDVLLEFDSSSGLLRVSLSDSENYLSLDVLPCRYDAGSASLSLCVPYASLSSYVKLLPSDVELCFEYSGVEVVEGSSLLLSHSGGSLSLPCMPSSSYPSLPLLSSDLSFSVPSSLLRGFFHPCASYLDGSGAANPLYSHVLFGHELGGLFVCATNARLLWHVHEPLACGDFRLLLDSRLLPLLSSFASYGDDVRVDVGSGRAMFSVGALSVVVRGHEGRYPDFRRVIPSSSDVRVDASRDELLSSVRRCVLSAGVDGTLRVVVSPGGLSMSSSDSSRGCSSSESLAVQSDGSLVIGLNGALLLRLLGALPSDAVRLSFCGASRPVLFSCGGGDAVSLLMPSVLNDVEP